MADELGCFGYFGKGRRVDEFTVDDVDAFKI